MRSHLVAAATGPPWEGDESKEVDLPKWHLQWTTENARHAILHRISVRSFRDTKLSKTLERFRTLLNMFETRRFLLDLFGLVRRGPTIVWAFRDNEMAILAR